MSTKPISLIIVTYNSSKTIIHLLKSLDTTKNSNLIKKIIIIENDSSDKSVTLNLVKKYKFTTKLSIQLISSNKNGGFAKSCNSGFKHTNTEYVLFLNPDTTVYTDSLEILYNHAKTECADIIGGVSQKNSNEVHNTVVRHPNLVIGLFEFSNLGKFFGIKIGHSRFYYEDIHNLYQSTNDRKVDAVGGAYLMARRTSFEKLKGFDEDFFMYLEDVDLGVRANRLKMNVVFCPHSKISHVSGASSVNRQHIRHQAWYDSRKKYFRKYYGLATNMIIQSLFIVEEALLKLRENILNYKHHE